jgi:hypothetical protein
MAAATTLGARYGRATLLNPPNSGEETLIAQTAGTADVVHLYRYASLAVRMDYRNTKPSYSLFFLSLSDMDYCWLPRPHRTGRCNVCP